MAGRKKQDLAQTDQDPELTPEAQAAQEPAPAAPDAQAGPEELMERLKRVTADYQNYQKRVAREMVDARERAKAELIREILVVVDDLERAMEASADSPQASAILDGVRITHEHLTGLLGRHGVSAIEAEGRPFDPQLHEAMMQQPSDQVEPMTVLRELVKGYTMHERTLRPARVVVAVRPSQEAEEQPD